MIEIDQTTRSPDTEIAPWLYDALLGIGVALLVSLFIAADITQEEPDPWAYLWAVGLGALMLARRRHPVIVVALSAGGVVSYYAAGLPPIGVAVPLAAAVFSAAEFGRMGAAITASVIVVAISLVYRLAIGQDPAYVGYELPGHALLLAGAIALGDSVRSRRELKHQAARIVALTKDQYARRAEQRVLAERLTIARELHDSVGHALTVVSLHTQVVEEALGRDDAEVRRSLKAISETTAETFGDLRRTVAGLRQPGPAPRSPLRLSNLDSATNPARQAGIQVSTRVRVESALSPAVEAAIFRIVQESVTNVVRHSSAERVEIGVEETGSAVDVSIVNDDAGPIPAGPSVVADGNGIVGMRERVHLLGGRFSAVQELAGFAVRASIPLERNEE